MFDLQREKTPGEQLQRRSSYYTTVALLISLVPNTLALWSTHKYRTLSIVMYAASLLLFGWAFWLQHKSRQLMKAEAKAS